MRGRYEKDTGQVLALPTSLGHLLGDLSIQGGPTEINEEEEKKQAAAMDGTQQTSRQAFQTQKKTFETLTFMEAIESLRLPKPEVQVKGKRGGQNRKEINFKPHHLLQKIDLSGFKERRISRSGLRELLDGLELMPCIRSLNLRHNGITDEFDKEVLALFDIHKIKAIDLSFNLMKRLGMQIAKKLRDEVVHLTWLDMTMNDFDNDTTTVNTLIQGVKKQLKMIYVGMTVQGAQSDQLVKILQPKRPPTSMSLNMRNSRLSKNCFDWLGKCLVGADFCLTALNLKFCFLTFEQIKKLADSLKFNKTLTKLDLSNNGLCSPVANYLLEALRNNIYVSEVNFHGNSLDDVFAEQLAGLLEHNQVLYKVDISANPISAVGAQQILTAVSEFNDTLGSLGDLEDSSFMGVRVREELRQAMKLNNASYDKKKAHLEDLTAHTVTTHVDANARPGAAGNKVVSSSEQAEYPLLKPITFTNVVTDDYLDSYVWQLR